MEEFITDMKTDAVCFSSLLTKFRLWVKLQKILCEFHIPYALIPHTKDIWVRDFMPIQMNKGRFVTFSFNPSYLSGLSEYHTDWVNWVERCIVHHHYPIENGKHVYTRHFISKSGLDIQLDGGNVIKCDDCVLITDRVFQENESIKKTTLLDSLEQVFSQEVFIIPSDPLEMTGHADGMVRYIGNGTVLLNHYVDFDMPLRQRLLKVLSPKFTIAEFHFGTNNCPATNWAYINYLQVGKLVVAPAVNERLDDIAIPQLEELLKTQIHTVPSLGIVRLGGGLNCLSWTTRGLVDNIEYDGMQGYI